MKSIEWYISFFITHDIIIHLWWVWISFSPAVFDRISQMREADVSDGTRSHSLCERTRHGAFVFTNIQTKLITGEELEILLETAPLEPVAHANFVLEPINTRADAVGDGACMHRYCFAGAHVALRESGPCEIRHRPNRGEEDNGGG